LNPATYSLASYDQLTNTATFNNNGIFADGNYTVTFVATAIQNRQTMNLSGDLVQDFFFLNADANRDRSVGLTDFTILATNFNTAGKTFSQGNFSYDAAGNVDLTDFTILAANFNKSLPSAAAALAAQGPAQAPRA